MSEAENGDAHDKLAGQSRNVRVPGSVRDLAPPQLPHPSESREKLRKTLNTSFRPPYIFAQTSKHMYTFNMQIHTHTQVFHVYM